MVSVFLAIAERIVRKYVRHGGKKRDVMLGDEWRSVNKSEEDNLTLLLWFI